MYLVSQMKEVMNVELMGLERPLELSWADGMIGAIPVFKDKESALAYANGNESLLIDIAEVKA